MVIQGCVGVGARFLTPSALPKLKLLPLIAACCASANSFSVIFPSVNFFSASFDLEQRRF